MSVRIVQHPQYAHTSLAASAPLQLLGRSRRAISPLRVAFSPTTAPHEVVAESAESNLAGNLAFGRAVLLTRVDGLEVPHYFSAYVICGGTTCAGQILSQERGGLYQSCQNVANPWKMVCFPV